MDKIDKIRLKVINFDTVSILNLDEQQIFISWLNSKYGTDIKGLLSILARIPPQDWSPDVDFGYNLSELQIINKKDLESEAEHIGETLELANYILQSKYATLTEEFLHNYSGLLHGLHLKGTFRGFNVCGVDFSYANLVDTDISAKQITDCSSIHRAILPVMDLDQVDFTGKDISHTRFSHCFSSRAAWCKGATNIEGVIPPYIRIK